jgi:hypothetical protein
MNAVRHLRIIDGETGEIAQDAPDVQTLIDEIAGLNTELRAWRTRYAKLKREEEQRAEESPLWTDAESLFSTWKRLCRHPRSCFGADRFLAIESILEQYGVEACEKAIKGAAYQPYETTRRNGTIKRHDDWCLIFRNRDKFEEFANRAPIGEQA